MIFSSLSTESLSNASISTIQCFFWPQKADACQTKTFMREMFRYSRLCTRSTKRQDYYAPELLGARLKNQTFFQKLKKLLFLIFFQNLFFILKNFSIFFYSKFILCLKTNLFCFK